MTLPDFPGVGSAWLWTAALTLAGYLLGSIPTAWLLTRRRRGQDIRQLGDGNMGAENAARLLGRYAGVFVALVDVGKGVAAILLARLLAGPEPSWPVALPGLAAIIGHSWPLWLKGPGGRGAAAAAGALLGLTPYAALPAALPALAVLYFTRSATGCLAAFFIGTVGLAAAYAGLNALGYSWPLVGAALAMPALTAAIHFSRQQKGRGRPIAR